jgi:hypothetical protein
MCGAAFFFGSATKTDGSGAANFVGGEDGRCYDDRRPRFPNNRFRAERDRFLFRVLEAKEREKIYADQ